MPQKNVVGSSGWIEYFADGPNARFFEAAILDASSLVVPSISIYVGIQGIQAAAQGANGEEAALHPRRSNAAWAQCSVGA